MPIELSWKAKRNGGIYCAPACGRGCTWAEYNKAVRDAKAIAKALGRGWHHSVHENLGWFASAAHKSNCMSVSRAGTSRYIAFLGEGLPGGRWAEYGTTPTAAVANVIKKAKFEMAGIKKLVRLASAA